MDDWSGVYMRDGDMIAAERAIDLRAADRLDTQVREVRHQLVGVD